MKLLLQTILSALLIWPTILIMAFSPCGSMNHHQSRLNQLSYLNMASIQFIRGLDEKVIPDVKLTRARDGSSGVASFTFKNPNCFDASTASKGEVMGMFLGDEEGEISTTDVNAKFSNGKPQSIEARLVLESPEKWDRFMRWMEKYAEGNGLGFNSANKQ